MASPVGTWDINANGFPGTLSIQQIDGAGNLGGSTVFGEQIIGLWDDTSQKLTFMRVSNPADPSTNQIYTGYLMEPQGNQPMALAGSFEAFQGSGGAATRSIFGWFATLR